MIEYGTTAITLTGPRGRCTVALSDRTETPPHLAGLLLAWLREGLRGSLPDHELGWNYRVSCEDLVARIADETGLRIDEILPRLQKEVEG